MSTSSTATSQHTARFERPDVLRGFAIVLMMFFHGWYDLSVFRFVDMSMKDPLWFSLRAVIVGLFCLTAGASLVWANGQHIHWPHWAKRQGQVALGALLVTAFSLFAYPDSWVYFGILHFFVVALTVSLPLLKHPRAALFLGLLLIVAERLNAPFTDPWVYDILQPLLNLPSGTLDRMYLLPWLGVVWLGIWLGHQPWLKGTVPVFYGKQTLLWLGRRPLLVYLVHQPVLFGLAWLVYIVSRVTF
ncbi:heparan-alpha-glucosaminide N-acetyltransferase [Salinispirillum marinum]|uniref:Heparan-alpha-glucosaminide N-acetyltransferase n=2 Tax=Saccharospirillaceae TaxID=255527 RepID=A0ABV8BHU2_9GAMM